MARFASNEWLAAYKDAINTGPYRDVSKDWKGNVTIVIEPEPDKGVEAEIWGWFDLAEGQCRDAKLVTPDEGERATYIIRAPYSAWKDVVRGRLDPVKGMVQGKLKLTGDLVSLTQNVAAAKELVSAAASIPTEFPDE
jgi:putative sterol carrier protein